MEKILARRDNWFNFKHIGSVFVFPYAAVFELTKPRILMMNLVTFLVGFFLSTGYFALTPFLLYALAGTALVIGGAGALNQYLDRDCDAKMERTASRALPSGRLKPLFALYFGICLVLGGTLVLVWKVNLLTGFLGLLSAFLYALVYTPLKRITTFHTLIGAVPGALPPVGGWAAATGGLDVGAWMLFFILFAWQQPHFYAIAWMFKDEYKRAGFKTLPVVEPDGRSTFREIILYSMLLIPLSLLPWAAGLTGSLYYFGALLLGIYILVEGIRVSKSKTEQDARRLLKASVVYLPLLLILIFFDMKI